MTGFHYVYILESLGAFGGFYIGLTGDLSGRLRKHNAGEVPHTATPDHGESRLRSPFGTERGPPYSRTT